MSRGRGGFRRKEVENKISNGFYRFDIGNIIQFLIAHELLSCILQKKLIFLLCSVINVITALVQKKLLIVQVV